MADAYKETVLDKYVNIELQCSCIHFHYGRRDFFNKEVVMGKFLLATLAGALLFVAASANAQTTKLAAAGAADQRLAGLEGRSCEGRYKVASQGYYQPDTGVLKLSFKGAAVHVEISSDHYGGYEDRGMSALHAGKNSPYEFSTTSKRGTGSTWGIDFITPVQLSLKGRTSMNGNIVEAVLDCN